MCSSNLTDVLSFLVTFLMKPENSSGSNYLILRVHEDVLNGTLHVQVKASQYNYSTLV